MGELCTVNDMYGLIRIIILLVILLSTGSIIHKRFGRNKKTEIKVLILTVILDLIVGVLLMVYPIEDVFISFDSIDAVFGYTSRGVVEHTIDGKNSTMAFGRREGSNVVYYVLPKDSKGWKIGSAKDLNVYHMQIPYKGLSIIVERFRDTDDYYVTIFDTSNEEKTIVDKNGTIYYKGYYDAGAGTCLYHAYVNRFDLDYYIIVNGRTIEMEPMN